MPKDVIIVDDRIWNSQLALLPPVVRKRAENFKILIEKASERGIVTMKEAEALLLVQELFPIMGKRTQKEYAGIVVVLLEKGKRDQLAHFVTEIGPDDEVECATCWNDDNARPYEGIPSDFEIHLKDVHGITLAQYFEKHPDRSFRVL